MAGSYALACADMGGAVAWIVPSYKNARPVWRFCEQVCAPIAGRLKVNRTERIIDFPSGGWLGVYTADNDTSIRGEAFDVAIVDEAARITEQTYLDVITPTLADRDGRCLLISTPKGKNWFWLEYQKALGDGRHAAAFTAPTSANPMPGIQRAFVLAKDRLPERTYRQEWLAEFLEDGAGVFRKVREAATATPQTWGQHNHGYVIGADWGRTNDATVFAVVDAVTSELVALERMTQTDYQQQLQRLWGVWQRFGGPPVIAELNSMGGPLVEHLQQSGMAVQGFVTTNASKTQIIDALALAFERGNLRILDDPLLIGELQAYESERLPGGAIRYSAPEGMHDDTVMALALAWSGVGSNNDAAILAAFGLA